MKVVRLFVLQDNSHHTFDVPHDHAAELQADLELAGATVYHSSLLSSPPKSRNFRSGAKLKQRLY